MYCEVITVFPLLCFISEAREADLLSTDPFKSGAWLILEPRRFRLKNTYQVTCAGYKQTVLIVMMTNQRHQELNRDTEK